MIYRDANAIFLSALFSSLHGVIIGAFALFLSLFFSFLLTAKKAVSESLAVNSISSIKENIKSLKGFTKTTTVKHSFFEDFLHAFVYGISLIILLYVACDGEFRLYIICISFFFAWIFKMTFGKWLNVIFEYMLYAIGAGLLFVFSVFCIPLKKIIFLIKQLYYKIASNMPKKAPEKSKYNNNTGKKTKISNKGIKKAK